MLYRTCLISFILLSAHAINCLGSSPRNGTISISVTVEAEAESVNSIELIAFDRQGLAGRLAAPIPSGFLAGDIREITVVEPSDTINTLATERLWLRISDSYLGPLSSLSQSDMGDMMELEYLPRAQDLPGLYHGKLIAHGDLVERTLDISIDIPPFVKYEIRSNSLLRDSDGNPTGQFEILVTSNARQWSLFYRLEKPTGGEPCADLRLGAVRATGSWEVATGSLCGVINGRGPIQDQLLVLVPQGSVDSSICDAVVVIEKATAR